MSQVNEETDEADCNSEERTDKNGRLSLTTKFTNRQWKLKPDTKKYAHLFFDTYVKDKDIGGHRE